MASVWEVRMSNSRGIHYFFNTTTRESRWDPPSELSESEVNQLPGAAQYLGRAAAPAPPAEQVRASHLLVKHRGSRRPSSWKEPNITRSQSEAVEILRGYASQIDGDPAMFGRLAKEYSDCSSHEKNGDLGWFGRGQMQRPFEDATYSLQVGEMSDVITTESGVHLILRTG
ncbi:rotamase-domain-containing protein [Ramaria rubella]|nr:rotamase-domain-containing protein [Ramaria rubella]